MYSNCVPTSTHCQLAPNSSFHRMCFCRSASETDDCTPPTQPKHFRSYERDERIRGSERTWTLATAASKSRMVTGISIWSCHHRHHASANSDERTPRPQRMRGLRRTCESARISAGVLPSIARRIAIMEASRQMLVMSAPE